MRYFFSKQSSKSAQRIPTKSGTDGGPFSSHCRTFDSQLKELNQQLLTVKERLEELHRDVAVLRRANTPPLGIRYEQVARDCRVLEQQLEHYQMELERLRNVFDTLWDEQLCRIHIEKEIFHSQVLFRFYYWQSLNVLKIRRLMNFFVHSDERYPIIEKSGKTIAESCSTIRTVYKIFRNRS